MEHVQLFKDKYSHHKKWHMEAIPQVARAHSVCSSGFFCACYAPVVHVLLCAMCSLIFPFGGEATVTLAMFPWGCEGNVMRQ